MVPLCLLAGYAVGTLFSPAPSVPSDNDITAKVDAQPAAVAKPQPLAEVIVLQQAQPTLANTDTIAALQDRILQLEQQLAQQAAEFELALMTADSSAAMGATARAKTAMRTMPLAEVEPLLPQPFAGLIAGSKGTLVERFQQLEKEAVDYDWAPLMEQRIADFISLHHLSSAIQLQSVRCKTNICEMRGFELEPQSWNQVLSSMQAQPWWQFNSTHSSSQSSNDFGQFFYTVASREQKSAVRE